MFDRTVLEGGKLQLELDYIFDEENGMVEIFHPSLDGKLSFRYTSLNLAHTQLNALRSDKQLSAIEEVMVDVDSILDSASKLKTLYSSL